MHMVRDNKHSSYERLIFIHIYAVSATLTLAFVCLCKLSFLPVFINYSFGEPGPTAPSTLCSWLKQVEPDVVFCCCRSSASRFKILCIQRCFLCYKVCWPLLSTTQWIFFLLQLWVNSRDCMKIQTVATAQIIKSTCFLSFQYLMKKFPEATILVY